MKIKNQQDFWAGAMFVGFGTFFTGLGMRYPLGTAAEMGPGFFPVALGIIVILLGIAITIRSMGSSTDSAGAMSPFHFRIVALILGPILAFGLLLKTLGLICSLLLVIVVSSLASHEFSWKATLLNAVGLILLCLVIFTWGLDLRFDLWPPFMKGAI